MQYSRSSLNHDNPNIALAGRSFGVAENYYFLGCTLKQVSTGYWEASERDLCLWQLFGH